MHPVERLRYIIGDRYVPTAMLVDEVAMAYAALGDDSAAGLTAMRRVLSRQAWCGPLWWLAARLLTAPDPYTECRELLRVFGSDRTAEELEAILKPDARVIVGGWPEQAALALVNRPDVAVIVVDLGSEGDVTARQLSSHGAQVVDVVRADRIDDAVKRADVVLLDASMAGPSEVVCLSGSRELAAAARAAEVHCWAVAGIGRRLPEWLFPSASNRAITADNAARPVEAVQAALVDALVCEVGLKRCPPLLGTPGFPRVTDLVFE